MTARGAVGGVYREALTYARRQFEAGVPQPDRVRALETLLRDVWPQVREWKYVCATCDDIGRRVVACPGDPTCGRRRPHAAHEFVVPCGCRFGDRFRRDPDRVVDAIPAPPRTARGRR